MDKTTRQTRKESYEAVLPKVKNRSRLILETLGSRQMTVSEITDELVKQEKIPYYNRNYVAPRLSELKDMGVVETCGRRKATHSNATEAIWRRKTTRKCYDCENYFESYFCGYNSHNCKVYGSIDMDQKERHPDTTAESCDRYKKKETTAQKEVSHKPEKIRPECPIVESLILRYKGRDSWDRPVYEDENGRLWKDVDPRADGKPKLCTALYNSFNGEPDVPMEAVERYKDTRIVFEPKRDTW